MSHEPNCPDCKEGYMEPEFVGIDGEGKEDFRQTGTNREYVCDKCGHKAVSASINEYVPLSDSVSQEKQEDSKNE